MSEIDRDTALALIGLHAIVRTAAERLGTDEATALEAIRANADSRWVRGMIAYAAETLAPIR